MKELFLQSHFQHLVHMHPMDRSNHTFSVLLLFHYYFLLFFYFLVSNVCYAKLAIPVSFSN